MSGRQSSTVSRFRRQCLRPTHAPAPFLVLGAWLLLSPVQGVTLTPGATGIAIEAAGYAATAGTDGSLTSLKIAGQEFLVSVDSFPRGGYMYQGGIHKTSAITQDGPDACLAETDLARWRYLFGEQSITLQIDNKSPKSILYVMVLDPGLQAVRDPSGRFRRIPANGSWADCTWFIGPAKLRLIAPASQWGPWGSGRNQVTTFTVPTKQSLTITMETGMSEAREQQLAKETAERPVIPPTDPVGPMWDLKRFSKPPKTYPAPGLEAEGVQSLFFDGPDYEGQPTRVFAWMGFPKDLAPGQKAPAIVLVHGGGGTAYDNWVRLWNSRGYAAIAMDTCGCIPVRTNDVWTRHEHAGPRGWGGYAQIDEAREDQWTFHAVAGALLAHSLLAAQPQVDPERIGVTGISWGGYLTSIIAGVDPRLKFAVPVYGCGFTNEHTFAPQVNNLGPERAARWMRWWDPSAYLPDAQMPMLWVTGTNDFAYTFNALQKSYRLPKSPRTLAIRLRMPHGHGPGGEAPDEIRVFADSIVRGGIPMAKITGQGREGVQVWATVEAPAGLTKAELVYTKDLGLWPDRLWEAVPAQLADGRVTATLPEGTTVYYLNVYDDRNCAVSSEHEELAR